MSPTRTVLPIIKLLFFILKTDENMKEKFRKLLRIVGKMLILKLNIYFAVVLFVLQCLFKFLLRFDDELFLEN